MRTVEPLYGIPVVLLGVFHTFVYLFPAEQQEIFWCTYIFTVFAILLQFPIIWKVHSIGKTMGFYRYSLILLYVVYLFLQLGIFMAGKYYPNADYATVLLMEVSVLGGFLLLFLLGEFYQKYILSLGENKKRGMRDETVDL